MERLLEKLILIFLTSLGMVMGGAILGSTPDVISGGRPAESMQKLAEDLKIWAVFAAIGGSFDSIRVLESGIFDGEVKSLIKQIFFIISSFFGAHLGVYLISSLTNGK